MAPTNTTLSTLAPSTIPCGELWAVDRAAYVTVLAEVMMLLELAAVPTHYVIQLAPTLGFSARWAPDSITVSRLELEIAELAYRHIMEWVVLSGHDDGLAGELQECWATVIASLEPMPA